MFILDDEVVYCAQKTSPFVTGDGKVTLRQLIAAETSALDRSRDFVGRHRSR